MNWNETNPNSLDYYIFYIFVLAILYALIMLLQNFLKNKNDERKVNVTLDYYAAKEGKQIIHDVLTVEQRSVRWKFLLASVAVKAATWVKAPYIFALYNRVHGFTRQEIGLLYAVDNVSSLILGPLIGSLCDMYGRKKFCILYCVCIIMHISLRITGSKELAWPAQFITGICSCLLDTAFESWVNFEANFLFDDTPEGKRQKNSYLRELFSKQITLDCFCSIILTGVATLLYMNYSIFYPFYACQIFAFAALLIIAFTWNENDVDMLKHLDKEKEPSKQSFIEKLTFSWQKLRSDIPLLCVGSIESNFKICLQLFMFIWTPLLEETVGSFVNPGAIFACFMLARLIGSEFFESLKIILAANSYLLSIFVTFTSSLSFLLVYYVYDFNTRLILFIYFDGLSGLFTPLFSSLKAQMIPEKLRTTIMNFFRIPINIVNIVLLIFTGILTTYQICLCAFVFMFFAFVLNLYLLKVHSPPDAEKREVVKTSEFLDLYEKTKSMLNKTKRV